MDFDMSAAGEGAAGGAAGGVAGGPQGMAIGALAGGIMGGFFGHKQKQLSLPWDQYNARLAAINDYENKLQGAENNWASAIGNYNNTMMSLATPNIAATAGAQGLAVNSGAVSAEVARQAAMYQAQGTQAIAKQKFTDLNNVENQRGSAWDTMFGAAAKTNALNWERDNNVGDAHDAMMGRIIGGLGAWGSSKMSSWGTGGNPSGASAGASSGYLPQADSLGINQRSMLAREF